MPVKLNEEKNMLSCVKLEKRNRKEFIAVVTRYQNTKHFITMVTRFQIRSLPQKRKRVALSLLRL